MGLSYVVAHARARSEQRCMGAANKLATRGPASVRATAGACHVAFARCELVRMALVVRLSMWNASALELAMRMPMEGAAAWATRRASRLSRVGNGHGGSVEVGRRHQCCHCRQLEQWCRLVKEPRWDP